MSTATLGISALQLQRQLGLKGYETASTAGRQLQVTVTADVAELPLVLGPMHCDQVLT
jgi:hypothetical protein